MRNRLDRWLAPLPRGVRRVLIAVIGSTLLLAGVLMLVLPGPGILVLLLALGLLATEFAWAESLLVHARIRAERLKNRLTHSREESHE
jgi:tellurite resistance protein TerC